MKMRKYFNVDKYRGYVPSSDEVLHSLGLQRRHPGTTIAEGLALFGIGCLVGAGAALLWAPRTGRELRDDLSVRAGQLKENISERIPQLAGRMKQPLGSSIIEQGTGAIGQGKI